MRNNAIDLETTKKKNIIVCGTEINSNPAAEVTWALILGLYRNMKQEIDNMCQGYWQTTIGFELKGKMLGLIGLGKIGTQVAKVGKAFGMAQGYEGGTEEDKIEGFKGAQGPGGIGEDGELIDNQRGTFQVFIDGFEIPKAGPASRSEEHTSELQSQD